MKEMARLDSDLEQGLLDDEAYRKSYEEKRAQLAELESREKKE